MWNNESCYDPWEFSEFQLHRWYKNIWQVTQKNVRHSYCRFEKVKHRMKISPLQSHYLCAFKIVLKIRKWYPNLYYSSEQLQVLKIKFLCHKQKIILHKLVVMFSCCFYILFTLKWNIKPTSSLNWLACSINKN